MQLDVMQYFLEAADMKSMSKLARRRGIPQQSMNHMILMLEKELGVKLFIRSGIGLILTEAGEEFYHFCKNFYADYRVIQQQLYPENNLPLQVFTVSAQNNIAQTVIPNWISTLLKYKPEIKLEIQIKSSTEIIEDVLSERAQIGFLLLFQKEKLLYPKLPEDIIFCPIFSSRPYFWVNNQNPLFRCKTLSAKMLESFTIIKDSNADQDLFDYIFGGHFGLQKPFFAAANAHIILQLIRDNIAICPDLKVQQGELGLAYLFQQDQDIKAIPLSRKDNYKIVTGYIIKKNVNISQEMKLILEYLK